MKIIITTSGIGKRLGNYTKYNNKTLVRVGNKYAICYIIEKYPMSSEFIITLGYYGDLVKQFLQLAYPNHNFTWVTIDKYEGDGSSLGYSLLQTRHLINSCFIYHCCDCIFMDEINLESLKGNYMFVWNGEKNSHNTNNFSSVNVGDKYVYKINNKGETNYDYFYIGVAYIQDHQLFFEILSKLVNENYMRQSLSDIHVYREFLNQSIKVGYKLINKWYDMGTITTFNNANDCLKCNYDVLHKDDESICFMDNYVIKYFHNKKVNLNRVKRAEILNSSTNNSLVPKILGNTNNFYKMDLVKGELLSKYYTQGEIYKLLKWADEKLWNLHRCPFHLNLRNEIKEIDKYDFREICYNFYIKKTQKRINNFKDLYNNLDYTIINGLEVGTIDNLWNKVNHNDLCDDVEPSFFHGDFILDNILKTEREYCLLDWRQDFGGELKFGDKYYDLAKLRHNIIVNHKNLEDGLFTIKQVNNNECIVDIKCNYFLIQQLEEFDKFVKENRLDFKKIKILMSLIWINMASLHEYPLSIFLYHFGKYNLYLSL